MKFFIDLWEALLTGLAAAKRQYRMNRYLRSRWMDPFKE